jgi:DNA-binding PadR family transcriptional regulator
LSDIDVVREFRRGAVRLHVLHHAVAGEVTGVWLSVELARHGYRISPGTLYPLLHSLQADGLVESRQHVENGRLLRYYKATPTGRATLAAARSALAELAGELLSDASAGPNSPAAPPRPAHG